MNLKRSDLVNLRMAVQQKVTATAVIEAVWVHGADPIAPTFFVMVNKLDGSGTPYSILSATLATAGANSTPGTITYPGNLNVTVGGTSYSTTTAAMTALVALEGAATP